MGSNQSLQKINYEDVQRASKGDGFTIISTLPPTRQGCLITGTVQCGQEEALLNDMMKTSQATKIIVYGLNCNDDTIYGKYDHLRKCGFSSVYLYVGGLFEWLCLQDIFGNELFGTTEAEDDLLKYQPASCLRQRLLTSFPHNA